ncbi:hypothetical protein BDV10DRAFT_190062 [Aspergillus recurvatus]
MSFRPLLDLASEVQETSAPWGLIIYRTTYTPLSETHFAKILDLIELLIKEDVRRYEDRNGTPEEREAARAILVPSYRPVVHDDKAQFNGMSLDNVRLHYQQYVEDVPVGQAGRPLTNKTFCVVIDDEVVENLATAEREQLLTLTPRGTFVVKKTAYWVKVVEADLQEEEDKGWMKCSIYRLWTLWTDMDGITGMSSWDAMNDGPFTG